MRLSTWAEIDLDEAVWTVPAARMKAGKDHLVPLSPPALSLLRPLPRISGNELVFPAQRGKALSDMTLTALTRRMDVPAVQHGFRSTFKDWASECTSYPGELSEMVFDEFAETVLQEVDERAKAAPVGASA